ncbi:hypothetical protein QAD02_017314 [Eretmocerus hayati]|uniref:Uncharacterized protein n=1 Tax=Eretmocerus hayati TaxID=131215 RepID=A0ACC2PGF4_9HYME|nr:hypothetical protein QAD02_017314 [Eretmocerus hayati]
MECVAARNYHMASMNSSTDQPPIHESQSEALPSSHAPSTVTSDHESGARGHGPVSCRIYVIACPKFRSARRRRASKARGRVRKHDDTAPDAAPLRYLWMAVTRPAAAKLTVNPRELIPLVCDPSECSVNYILHCADEFLSSDARETLVSGLGAVQAISAADGR